MKISTILLIIALLIIFMFNFKTIPEQFANMSDISGTSNKIIYDTIPYANSGLFYNYLIGSPYWYNPLDYWLNPYMYYNWYGSGPIGSSYISSSSSSNYSPRIHKRIRHTRTRRIRH